MKLAILAGLLAVSGCTHSKEIRPGDDLVIRGTEAQIAALLTDQRLRNGSSLKLVSDVRPRKGVRELRYSFAADTPYRDIGGLVFYAQSHGAKTTFEAD